MADGMPAPEARRSALVELGGAEQLKQVVRDERAGAGVERLWQDIQFRSTTTTPFTSFRSHGPVDHHDRAWGYNGNVQHRRSRDSEAFALCRARSAGSGRG